MSDGAYCARARAADALAYCAIVTIRAAGAWLSLVTVCLALAGCGSDDSAPEVGSGEEAAVAAAVKDYLTALGTLDAAGVCDSLTEAAQRDLVSRSGSTQTECDKVVALGFQFLSEEQKLALAEQRSLEPFGLEVSGSTATGRLELSGKTSRFEAEKVRGRWKLSSPGEEQLAPG